MRQSMTAYGRAALQTKRARWTLEISSVNRKGLDIHLHLPHSLMFLDPTIRKWVGRIAERGNLTIRLSCQMRDRAELAKQLRAEKKRWDAIADDLQLSKNQVSLSFLMDQINPQEVEVSPSAVEKELAQVWKKASQAWLEMKKQEGKALTADIYARLKFIEQEMKGIEKEIPKLVKESLAKLLERMKELKVAADPQQLSVEAALQAGRSDVTEEMIRLKSHIEQMGLYLKSGEKSVGRVLDFLAQEMGREIGTLMAKAGSSEITKKAVSIKGEIEKIREQVQNIE